MFHIIIIINIINQGRQHWRGIRASLCHSFSWKLWWTKTRSCLTIWSWWNNYKLFIVLPTESIFKMIHKHSYHNFIQFLFCFKRSPNSVRVTDMTYIFRFIVESKKVCATRLLLLFPLSQIDAIFTCDKITLLFLLAKVEPVHVWLM